MKYKKLLAIVLFLAFYGLTELQAQIQIYTVIPAGTAGNTNGGGADPINRNYSAIHFQVVYTAAELVASGMPADFIISGLAWNVTESSVQLQNYTIKMGHTSAPNSASHNTDALIAVKNPFTYNVATGYDDIFFDSPFTWNGTDNIIVDICTGPSNPYTSPYGGVQVATAYSSGSRYYQVDGSDACSTSTTSVLSSKPYIRFTGFPSYTSPVVTANTAVLNFGHTDIDSTSLPQTCLIYGFGLINSPITVQAPDDFEVSLNGINWSEAVDIAYTPPTLAPTTIYVRFVPTVNNLSYSDSIIYSGGSFSTIVAVSGNSYVYGSYCSSIAGYTSGSEISNVTFGTLNNSSDCGTVAPDPGSKNKKYSNYTLTVPVVNVEREHSYAFSASIITCGSTFSNALKVFIDWNQDNDFTESDEIVFISQTYAENATTEVGNITIPSTALPGYTMMRVVNASTTDPLAISSCGTYTYGETEDYLVNVLPNTSPYLIVAPFLLPFNYIAPDSISSVRTYTLSGFNLTSSPITVTAPAGFEVSTDGTNWVNSVVIAFTPPFLPDTSIKVRFVPTVINTNYNGIITNSGGGALTVNAYAFGSSIVSSAYCTSNALSESSEEISNVTIGTMNNYSSCSITGGAGSSLNKYSDFSTTLAPIGLVKNLTYPFSVSIAYCGSAAGNNAVKIFIDWNHDGDFADTGENSYVSSAITNGVHTETGTIIVPSTATTGYTLMRVIGCATTNPQNINSCGEYMYGETEDYLVTITEPVVPYLYSSTSSLSFNYVAYGSFSSIQTYTLTGGNLTSSPVTVTAPAGFQVSLDGINWVSTFNVVMPASIETDTIVYVRFAPTAVNTNYTGTITNSGGGASVFNIMVSGTSLVYSGYCASLASGTTGSNISNVTLNTLNNSSDCITAAAGPGSILKRYANYSTTVPSVDLAKYLNVPFSVSIAACSGTTATNGFKIFIDWNHDLDFSDPEEEVYVSPASPVLIYNVTGNIYVPPTALNGYTLMRVVHCITGSPSGITPCGTYAKGETEDYLVNIVDPVVPYLYATADNLSFDYIAFGDSSSIQTYTLSGGNLTSSPVTIAAPAGFQISSDGTNWSSSFDIAYTPPSLPDTSIKVRFVPNAINIDYSGTITNSGGGASTFNISINGTSAISSNYCISSANLSNETDISNVTIGALNNSSDCSTPAPGLGSILGRYSNFSTSVPALLLTKYTYYPFSVTMTSCDAQWDNSIKIFIDCNHDFDFLDAGEEVYVSPAYTDGDHSEMGTIILPVTALPGYTLMRIVNVEDVSPATISSCGTYDFGETEDYSVKIIEQTAPYLYITPENLSFNFVAFGDSSLAKTFTLSGGNLMSSPVTITAPAGFEVSVNGTTWSNTLAITNTFPDFTDTNVYVRFNPSAFNINFAGLINISGGGAVAVDVAVSGTSEMYTGYCTSAANITSGEDISNITFASLNNTSNCSTIAPGPGSILNRYSNFTTTVPAATIVQGDSYPFSLTNLCGTTSSNAFKIFIDWNHDYDFTDTAENVYVSPAYINGNHTESGNILVPASAATGFTMMRVVNVHTTNPAGINPCGTYSYGETEDYLVQVVESSNPYLIVSAANFNSFNYVAYGSSSSAQTYTLSGNNLTTSPLTVTAPAGFKVSADGINWVDTLTIVYTPPTLEDTIIYVRFVPTAVNANYSDFIVNSGGGATAINVGVSGSSVIYANYCSSSANSSNDTEISNVTFGTLTNTSDCATVAPGPGSILRRYSNYTTTVPAVEVELEHTYTFSVTMTSCGGNYYNGIKIFFDWNHDNDFSDTGEEVYVSPVSKFGNHTESGYITIPSTAITGYTIMRVVCTETTNPLNITACGTYNYGETEDYLVNIMPSASPYLNISPFSLAFNYIAPGNISPTKVYELSGGNLPLSPVVISAPSGFEVSLNDTIWSDTLSINPGSPTLDSIAVYVRFAPNAVNTNYSANISNSASGAITLNVAVSGTSSTYTAYCASNAEGTGGADISNVILGSLNNSSDCSTTGSSGSLLNKYSNYSTTVPAVELLAGQNYPFSATISLCTGNTSNAIKIFIDWNHDNDFTDTGEEVYVSPNSSTGNYTETGSIIVPSSALPGYTLMRIVCTETANPLAITSCGSYSYGETEDYLIKIIDPDSPYLLVSDLALSFNYVLFGTTSSPQTYSLSGYNLTSSPLTIAAPAGFEVSLNGTTWGNTQNIAFTPPTLVDTTIYVRFAPTVINTNYAGSITNSGGGASSLFVAVSGTSVVCTNYCSSNANSADGDDITNVSFGPLNNSSSCSTTGGSGSILNQYSNYSCTIPAAEVESGHMYPFSVNINSCTSNYNNALKIFIDWNHDFDFTDAGEEVFVSPVSHIGNYTESGSIAVPPTAIIGYTLMRVVCCETTNPQAISSCGTYGYGETEDYLLNIVPSITPYLYLTPTALTFNYTAFGDISTTQTYTISGGNLSSSPVTVTAPVGFEVSLNQISWSNTLNINYTPPTLATTTIYVRFIPDASNIIYTDTIMNSGGGAIPLKVAVSGSSVTCSNYCTSSATNQIDTEISNVTFGTLNNTSDCITVAPGPGSVLKMYSNYTTSVPAADIEQGLSYPFSATITSCGGSYNNALKIFIDWNHDGDFSDSGENVYVSPADTNGNHTESGSITVPSTAILGYTLMRVVCTETSNPQNITPCGTYQYGETEDYLVKVVNVNPYLLTTVDSLSYNYTAFPGSSAPQSYLLSGENLTSSPVTVSAPAGFQVSLNGTTWSSSVTVNFTPPILAPTTICVRFLPTAFNTSYTGNISNSGGGASPVSIVVTGTSELYANYCVSGAYNAEYADITTVKFGTLNNTSDCSVPAPGPGSSINRYSNYTTSVPATNIEVGHSYPFSLTMTFCLNNYDHAMKIFIDWNQDGDFTDSGEEVYVSPASSDEDHIETGSIAVPPTAMTGYTMMRVVCEQTWDPSSISSCELYSFGETEDYLVNILPSASPYLYALPTSLAFNYIAFGNSSPIQTYTLSGDDLTSSPVSITPPVGFEVSLNGTTWSNNLNVVFTPPTLAEKTIYVRFVPTAFNTNYSGNIANSGGGAQTVNIAVTGTSEIYANYCASTAYITDYEDIVNVTLGSLNNTSTCISTGGTGSVLNEYSNYTLTIPPVNIAQGSSYNFSVSVKLCDPSLGFHSVKAFIDWNQDGDFMDTNEDIYVSPSYSYGDYTESANIMAPANALPGYTMMRVICADAFIPSDISPCGDYENGETEDYLVNVVDPNNPLLTVTPNIQAFNYVAYGDSSYSQAFSLSGLNLTSSPVSITAPAGFEVSLNSSTWSNTASVAFTPPILSTITIYVRFVPTSFNTNYTGFITNAGGGANTVYVAVSGSSEPYTNYCISSAVVSIDADISNVTLAALNNTSDCSTTGGPGSILNRYSNYTQTVPAVELSQGHSYPFSLSTLTCNFEEFNACKIFIDWNGDFDFTDADEEVYVSPSSFYWDNTETGSISVPSTASLGYTLMRVIISETENPVEITPCELYAYGETEDYLVKVDDGSSVFELSNEGDMFIVYPNPATDKLLVECLLPVSQNFSAEVFSATGQQCLFIEGIINKAVLDISRLNRGVYFIRLKMSNGEWAIKKFVKE